ncbi:MAG: hypothetical protein H6719_02065 [Sandaracinaceae bacterium]|nr:hypothetical protein [Sandaracinaceae bacterium]
MPRPWLRNPFYDVALLAFCWVPVYLWVVFGLGLGGDVYGLAPLTSGQQARALSLAAVVVLGLTYVHRHYTFVFVYGDRETFKERGVAYVFSPILVFGTAAYLLTLQEPIHVAGTTIAPFVLMLVVSGVWNVWHTVQQRYGILRAYAGRAKGGLETRAHARRDRVLLWTLVLALSFVLPVVRPRTFAAHPSAMRVLGTLHPYVSHPAYTAALAVVGVATLAVVVWWARAERAARADKGPRWIFLGSTVLLLVVFVVHGPIVGYLCFGAAHALEYLAFVHHFAERSWRGRPERGFAAVVLGRPLAFAPVLVAALGLSFLWLQDYRTTEVYLAYYVGGSMLHFLYDGWIWKLRKKKVSRPLGA